MTVPAGLLEIGHLRRAHGVRGQVNVQLGTDRLERLVPGTRWFARDGWLTVVAASGSGLLHRFDFSCLGSVRSGNAGNSEAGISL